VIPMTLENTTQGELQRYENNYKALNVVTTILGRNVCDRIAHLETADGVWLKLCNTNECSSEIKFSRKKLTIGSIKPFFRNLQSLLLIALLGLSRL
jgi:hypothetical protein